MISDYFTKVVYPKILNLIWMSCLWQYVGNYDLPKYSDHPCELHCVQQILESHSFCRTVPTFP